MPSIEVKYEDRDTVSAAHAEYTRATGDIETLIEGPPAFSGGAVATGYTLIVPQGFVDYLKAKSIPFKLAV